MRYLVALLVFMTLPFAAVAQDGDDDPGYLAGLLQDALSGAGRDVRIRGFEGALSSEASIALISISDAQGEWFRAENVTLDWNRSALLRGAVDVESFTADRIVLSRAPDAGPDVPSAEATPFQIPDLPVSINIEEIAARSVVLGAPLLGEEAEFSVNGAAALDDGGVDVSFNLDRIDGQQAQIALSASYDPGSRQLSVDLSAQEAAGGLASGLLGIPDAPSIALDVQGEGPIDDFTAEIALSTNEQPRIAGTVTVLAPQDEGGWDIEVDIEGDPTPLLTEEVQPFFGDAIALQARVVQTPEGALTLPQFDLSANAVTLSGSAALSAEGWLTALDASGRIANPEGGPTVLPTGGGDTLVDEITFEAAFDDQLTVDARLRGLQNPAVALDLVTLSARGEIDPATLAETGQLGLDISWAAEGLALADPALAEAVGDSLNGGARIDYQSGQPVRVTDIEANGAEYGLSGTATFDSAETIPLALDLRLVAQDIQRFSAFAGRDLDGRAEVSVTGSVAPISGMFDIAIDGTTLDLQVGQDILNRALAGVGSVQLDARRDETGTTLRQARVVTPAATIEATGKITSEQTSLNFDAALGNLNQLFPGEAEGRAVLDGSIALSGAQLRSAEVIANLENGQAAVRLPVLDGLTLADGRVALTATGGPAGTWNLDAALRDVSASLLSAGTLGLTGGGELRQAETGAIASLSGQIETETQALRITDAQLSQAIGSSPSANVSFDWQQDAEQLTVGAINVETGAIDVSGSALVRQALTRPDAEFEVTVAAQSLAPLSGLAGQSLRGQATLDVAGSYVQDGGFDLSADGTARNLGINNPTVDQLLAGVTTFQFGVTGEANAIDSLSAEIENQELSAQVSGSLSELNINARLRNVGLLASDFQGPLAVEGQVGQQNGGYTVDVDVQGPGGTTLAIAGSVASAQSANLSIDGTAPLGLANAFIEPRRVNGQARLDLSLSGPLALGSLSGTITPVGAQFSAPTLGIVLDPITGQLQIQNGAVAVDLTAQGNNGGSVTVGGRLGLASFDAGLTATLNGFGVRDPALYDTSLDGTVNLTGPIGRDLLISGDLRINETEIRVPSSGLSALGDLPDINHIGATRPVMRTLDRANVTDEDDASVPEQTRPSAIRLDLTLTAPGQVFVRGRGLDAELAGSLRLTGPTSDIIPQGGFELVRGRLDILNQRFVLDEGRIQMSGSFTPILRFVATTDANGITVSVILDGPASSPDITFTSNPELPEDEVLAQLIFGRNLSNLSALQALELANAVATLAGGGGISIISNLRDGFGLDDLDVSQTEDGGTAVRAGKYLSENIYSDVVVESGGRTEINLNLDITDDISARGSVDNTGDSSLGIFFERDY